MRRFGDPVLTGKRYIRRPGAYAVLLYGSDVLVTHQMEPSPEFQLPGGGIDPGESPAQALHREVFEETGWRIGKVRRLGCHRRFTFMPEYDLWAEKICAIYLAKPIRRLGPPSEDGHTAVWMPLETATTLIANPGDRAALRQVLNGIV